MARVNDMVALRRNDDQLTYLQLLRPEVELTNCGLSELVDVLEDNTYVRRVRALVQRDFFLISSAETTESSEEEERYQLRRRLFTAVGSLPKLEQLKIDSYTGLVTFPINVLSQTILHARHLKELELWDLKLMATKYAAEGSGDQYQKNRYISDDFDGLRLSLQNHPCLQRFTLYNCQSLTSTVSNDTTTTTTCSLDPLLHALATMPNLQQVYITAAAAASSASTSMTFSCSALEHLCRSKSLQELGLWKFNFSSAASTSAQKEPLTVMAQSMTESSTLKMFEFGKCHLSHQGDQAIARMLRTNTSLEELDLHLDDAATENCSNCDHHDDDNDCHIVATAKALETHNRTLRSLKLWGLLSRRNQEALVQMARHNYVLQTCRLLDADCDVSNLIEFYIRLNRRGRNNLLTNNAVGYSQWMDFFAQCDRKDDLSTIFYYLSMKPSLCTMRR